LVGGGGGGGGVVINKHPNKGGAQNLLL